MTSKAKLAVLVFIDWFYPGYLAGGPVQSVVSLIEYLNKEIDFWIVTSDRDLNKNTRHEGIVVDEWMDCPLNCKVYYVSPGSLSKSIIRKLIKESECETIYLNSFFSKNFSIRPLILLKKEFPERRLILAPRGMLGKGALSIKKHKKEVFIFFSKILRLHHNVLWHATSNEELKEIKIVFGEKANAINVANLPKRVEVLGHEKKQIGKLKLFFPSRISPKKNLLFALEALAGIRSAEISYHIYGLLEDESYWTKCEKQINILPDNIKVEFSGPFRPEQTSEVYAREEVLLLPTRNENYGHAIVESLSCGCPVIISDQTPWRKLQENKAGFDLPLEDKQAFVKAIETFAKMDEAEFSLYRKGAFSYIEQKIDLPQIRQQYKSLFHV